MVVLVGMGEHMAERFLPIYLLALGGSAFSIGLLNAMDNLLSALYSYPGGYLADRIGVRRSLLAFNLLAACGFAVVILIPAWQAVLAGAVLFISWSAISLPATISLIFRVLPRDKRVMGVSMHSLVRRIPMALGPVLGGICIGYWGERDGVRAAFTFALFLSLAALVLQQLLIEERGASPAAGANPEGGVGTPANLIRSMPRGMRRLLMTDILVRFCEQIPYPFVIVWCMKVIEHPVSAVQFGILTAIEMVTALLIYIPVAYAADRSTKKPFVVITFAFFTLFPLALMLSRSFAALLPAFVLRGLKEFGEPTRKAMIMDLAPQNSKARMFGAYYLVRDLVVSVAALGGAVLWQISPQANFLTACVFGLLGTAGLAWFGEERL
jgi:MFS family permease